MKKDILLLSCIFIYFSCTASNLNSFIKINSEWENNIDGQKFSETFIAKQTMSSNDWIVAHLMLVERTLRQRPVDHLNSSQQLNRIKLLNTLNEYWHTKKFPINTYLPITSPVFIDSTGTHCAVGFLMQQSGAELLARKIDAGNKFVYVKDIKTNGVAVWAYENGFSIEELAWIQPGYPPTLPINDMAGGLNGSVKVLAIDPATQLYYAGGNFTASTKGAVCNGIAVYLSGIAGWDWIGLGNGVNGTVNALMFFNDKLYVGGEFTMAGTAQAGNIAIYDPLTQQWQSMGNLDSTVNSLTVYNNEIYAGGRFSGMVSKWTGSQWQDITSGFIYDGEVRTLEAWDNILLIGGNFELLTGALRKNVATFDGIQMGTSGFGTITPVNDFEVFHDTMYAACDVIAGGDTCALARFIDPDWEVILTPFGSISDYFYGNSILQLSVAENRLFGVGNFSCASNLTYGNGLMEINFDSLSGQIQCSPLVLLDSTVNTMVTNNNVITIGGEFIVDIVDTLNHVGQLENVLTKIDDAVQVRNMSLTIYPNPSRDLVNIQLNGYPFSKPVNVIILDQAGRLIISKQISQAIFSLDLSRSGAGVYTIRVLDDHGSMLAAQNFMIK